MAVFHRRFSIHAVERLAAKKFRPSPPLSALLSPPLLSRKKAMPWSYLIDEDRDVVITTGSGVVTATEFQTGLQMMFADKRFHPGCRCLGNYEDVTDWQCTTATMTSMAKNRQFTRKSRTAIFVTTSLCFGMARAYQMFVASGDLKIFTDRTEALAWLNEASPPEKHLT